MSIPGAKTIAFLIVNHLFAGPRCFGIKRSVMRMAGFEIGDGTKIVGPVYCDVANLKIGQNCWIGKNLLVNGNGTVTIGDNCDIAPEVAFQTGGHEIGTKERRAGTGICFDISVGNGCWIGARSTILGGVNVGDSCVVAACACVNKSVDRDRLVGGVPARVIRNLD